MANNDSADSEPETCCGDQVGLREKKRRETRRSIEDSATDLVLELGYDNVTVENICAGAGISRRTFFNYFDSKDAAVFGDGLAPKPDALSGFRDGPARDPLLAVTDLIGDIIAEPPGSDTDLEDPAARHRRLLAKRKAIIHGNPTLARTWLIGFETDRMALRNAVLEHMTVNPSTRRCPDMAPEEEAALVANLSRLIGSDAVLYNTGADDPIKAAVDKLTRFITAEPHPGVTGTAVGGTSGPDGAHDDNTDDNEMEVR